MTVPIRGQLVRVGAALALLLCACGGRAVPPQSTDGGPDAAGPTPYPADYTSGTRLRARTWKAGGVALGVDTLDGASEQVWYDEQLAVPCTFVGHDGAFTCAPLAAFADPGNFGLPVLGFADATCGDRVVVGPAGPAGAASRDAYCAAKRYARLLEITDAGVTVSLYEVGASFDGPTWYAAQPGQPGDCAPVDVVAPSSFHRTGRKVSDSEFVAAHVQTLASGHRLSPIVLVADDGTRQRIGWHDERLNVDCTVRESGDGKTRCLPKVGEAFFLPNLFADACKTFVAIPTSASSHAGDLVTPESVVPAGIKADAYYRLGPEVKTLYEIAADGSCVEAQSIPGLYAVTDELPLTAMDELQAAPRDVGRLRVAELADADGAVERFPSSLTDTSTGGRCAPTRTSDGAMRCLPDAPNQRHGDAACTAATRVVSVGPGGQPPAYAIHWKGDICAGGYDVFSVGAATAGPERTYDTDAYGAGCYLNPFAHPGDLSYFSIADPVALDMFVETVLVTE